MLDEGLGDAGVDPVVGHLVAHPEGAPAQRQLAQVPGAQHDAAAPARDAEQQVGAQPGLDVLEGDVVDLPPPLAAPVGVVHGGEHPLGERADVQLLDVAAQRPRQRQRVGLRPGAGGEARHGDGVDVLAAQAQAVDGAGGHDECVGRVQPPAHADDDPGLADGAQPLDEGGDLDVVGLVAVLGESGRVVGDEGEAVDGAPQPDVGAGDGQVAPADAHGPEAGAPGTGAGAQQGPAVVLEGALAHPLGEQALDVDVDDRGAGALAEALGGAQQLAVLVDEGLPVPGQVRGGLPLPGGGEDVGGQAPRAGGPDQQLAVLGPSHGDGRAGQVDQDRGARQRRQGRGRHGHPHVLADLGVEDQARHVVDLEQQVGAEGDARAVDVDVALAGVAPAGEVPLLVELAVGGRVGLGDDAAHRPAGDDDGAVEQAPARPQGGAHDDRRQEPGGGGADGLDGGQGPAQQDVGQEEVVDGVAGQAQFGEDGQAHALLAQAAGPGDHGGRVGGRVRQGHGQGDGGHAREALVVGGAELDVGRGAGLCHGAILPRRGRGRGMIGP